MTTTLPKAVLFDLLTALLDSWTLWNDVAGSEARGRAWRAEYLRLTYGCGRYVPYEQLVREAAVTTGLPAAAADTLEARWLELPPWSDLSELRALAVMKGLMDRGVPKTRMAYVGYGMSRPIADNSTPEGRMLNRRTEIIILDERKENIGSPLEDLAGFFNGVVELGKRLFN